MQIQLPTPVINEKGPFTLVGQAIAQEGKADGLEQRLLSLVAPTRLESGCVAYHVHRDRDNKNKFVFYEAWASKEALEAHLQMPYIQDYLKDRMQYLTEDMSITWLEMRSPYA